MLFVLLLQVDPLDQGARFVLENFIHDSFTDGIKQMIDKVAALRGN